MLSNIRFVIHLARCCWSVNTGAERGRSYRLQRAGSHGLLNLSGLSPESLPYSNISRHPLTWSDRRAGTTLCHQGQIYQQPIDRALVIEALKSEYCYFCLCFPSSTKSHTCTVSLELPPRMRSSCANAISHKIIHFPIRLWRQ